MPVIMNGFSLRPGPQVILEREPRRLPDGRLIGVTVRATLRGTIVAENPSGTHVPVPAEERLARILARQRSIRSAFGNGGMFEVQGWDGSTPTKFQARVINVQFEEGNWFEKCDYTITLEGDGFAGEGDTITYIESFDESWEFEEAEDPRMSRVTHNLSARGLEGGGNAGWQNAKNFVNSMLGIGFTAAGAWSPVSGQGHMGSSAHSPASSTRWNHSVRDSVEESGGYSVTETWLLNNDNYIEDQTISTRRVDEGNVTTVVAIQGTIRGFADKNSDVETKYSAALTAWNTIKSDLNTRAVEAASSVSGGSLNEHPSSVSVDHNKDEGTVSYSYEFNDATYVEDTLEEYSVSKQADIESNEVTVSVRGTISGAAYLDESITPSLKFDRAKARWQAIRPTLLSRATEDGGVSGLQPFPLSASVDFDKENGSISYDFQYSNRTDPNYRHDFTVTKSYSKQDDIYTYSIDGSITGLRSSTPDDPFANPLPEEKYNNAVSYYNQIKEDMLGLITTYAGPNEDINLSPETESTGHAPKSGTITYNVVYNTAPTPCTPNALSERWTETNEKGTRVVAIVPVIGRASGPIFQDMGTIREHRRTLTVEIVFKRPNDPCAPSPAPTVDIAPYEPSGSEVHKEQDQESWDKSEGRYSRTVVWAYNN